MLLYFSCGFGTTLAEGSTHGQTQRPFDRRAMGQDRAAPPTDAAIPARRAPLGEPSSRRGRHSVGAENRRALARFARGVSESLDVLAPAEALGRGRDVAPDLARVHRRHLCPGEKEGADIGPTKRGKGSKCVVLVERQGIPLGIRVTSASPTEITLAEATLNTRVTPHRRHPKHLLGDRAYDSDPLRQRLAARGARQRAAVLAVPRSVLGDNGGGDEWCPAALISAWSSLRSTISSRPHTVFKARGHPIAHEGHDEGKRSSDHSQVLAVE